LNVGSEHLIEDNAQLNSVLSLNYLQPLTQLLPINPFVVIFIALVLSLEQGAFEDDHSHNEDVLPEGILSQIVELLALYHPALLGGEVDVLDVTLVEDYIKIGTHRGGEDIDNFGNAIRGEQYGLGGEAFMRFFIFLIRCQSLRNLQNERPEFELGEGLLE
jgi:hypothetical protein